VAVDTVLTTIGYTYSNVY